MKCNGYILAGGQSSRMGTDKGLLPLGETTFAGKLLETLQPLFKKVYFCGGSEVYQKFDVPVLPDSSLDCGPIMGLLTGLSNSKNEAKTEWNFFVPVDSPLVSAALIQTLSAHLPTDDSFDCVLPIQDGRMHYLIGFYRTSLWKDVQEYMADGGSSLKGFIPKIKCKQVEILDPIPLQNFNTPGDMEGLNSVSV